MSASSKMLQIEKQLSKNPQWHEVKSVIKKLSEAGYQAVLAGGSVRNALLNVDLQDFDVASSATPQEVLKVFPRGKKIWSQYGVIILPFTKSKGHIEITSFREESSYKDGRRPETVKMASIEEDVQRRDFTINALFYDIKENKIIDLVNGLKDLKNKVLRTVGDPSKRFEEDHLRVLRAVRFVHQFDLSLEKETEKSVLSCASLVQSIAQERITQEILKMFSVGRLSEGLKKLEKYKLLSLVFHLPENPKREPHIFWKKAEKVFKDYDCLWMFVGLPYLETKEEVKRYLKSLKISSKKISKNLFYFQSLKILLSEQYSFFDKLICLSKEPKFLQQLTLLWCDSYNLPKENLYLLFEEFKKRTPWPEPLVTSEDLLKAGYDPNVHFGKMLDKSFQLQIENPNRSKSEILKYLEKNY